MFFKKRLFVIIVSNILQPARFWPEWDNLDYKSAKTYLISNDKKPILCLEINKLFYSQKFAWAKKVFWKDSYPSEHDDEDCHLNGTTCLVLSDSYIQLTLDIKRFFDG